MQQKVTRRGDTLFDSVRSQLDVLVPSFGLEMQRAQVQQAYELICRESMDIPWGKRPPDFSRINNDGTPFQYSLSLGAERPSLQFLSETGVPGSSVAERMTLSLQRIRELASLFRSDSELDGIGSLIHRLVPEDDPTLLSDPSGATWIGVTFHPTAPPKMTVYINAKWGEGKGAWDRLDSFVSFFSEAPSWTKSRALFDAKMNPLGMAITIGEGSQPYGRAYLSAYGNPLSYYRELVNSTNDERFSATFEKFVGAFLGEERLYPLRSVVCSYGLGTGSPADFKFELCGHCSLISDTQAEAKCLEWLASISADPSLYSFLLRALADGHLSRNTVELHSYMGLGLRKGEFSTTMYLKPRWTDGDS